MWLGEYEESNGNSETAADYYGHSLKYNQQALDYTEILFSRGGKTDQRQLAAAYNNTAASLTKIGRNDEALKNSEICLKLIQGMRKSDGNNRELILDEVSAAYDHQKILAAQGKFDAALKEIELALDLAEESYRRDSLNIDAISLIGSLLNEAAKLLQNQKKENEAEKYRQFFLDYQKQYKEKFGTDWDIRL